MSSPGEFYLAQVSSCAKAANESPLPNLREKYLRAQAAWQALADREFGVKAAREKREAEKAAESMVGAGLDAPEFSGSAQSTLPA